MALALAAAIFLIFAANICLAAFGAGRFMGDLGEMLTLFAASAAFVAAILKREAKAKDQAEK